LEVVDVESLRLQLNARHLEHWSDNLEDGWTEAKAQVSR